MLDFFVFIFVVCLIMGGFFLIAPWVIHGMEWYMDWVENFFESKK